MDDTEFHNILLLLNRYFDGLYHSNTLLLASVFHEDAAYICATDEKLLQLDMEAYFPIVEARASPHSRNEMRQDNIRSIQFAGPKTAFAHVNCAIGTKYFTDFLSLIKTDDGWRIISKVFHYETRNS